MRLELNLFRWRRGMVELCSRNRTPVVSRASDSATTATGAAARMTAPSTALRAGKQTAPELLRSSGPVMSLATYG